MHRIPVRPPPPSASGRQRAVAVAGGKAEGLPRHGLALLLALVVPVGIVGRGGCAKHEQEQRRDGHAEEEQEQQGGTAK